MVVYFFQETGAASFHVFHCYRTELTLYFRLAVLRFLATEKQSKNKIQDLFTTMIMLMVMSKSVNNVVLRHVRKMSDLQKCSLPLILNSSLKVRQLKDLLLPLHLQTLAKYCI